MIPVGPETLHLRLGTPAWCPAVRTRVRPQIVFATAATLAILVAGCSGGSRDVSDGAPPAFEGIDGVLSVAEVRECASPAPAWIWCDDFEVDRLDRYFEHSDASGSFVRSPGVGIGGSTGMRARFRRGQVDAGSLRLAFGRTPQRYFRPVDDGSRAYRDIYWRIYIRHQDGWVGGGGDKLSRATSFVSPDTWAQAMIAHVWSGSGDHRDVLVLDPASGTSESGVLRTVRYNDFPNLRWLGQAVGTRPIFDAEGVGRWHCVEARARLDEPGSADGVFELWIDGKLESRAEGLDWTGSETGYGINAVFLENYWNDGSPRDQERYFDGFVVSTARIGC